MDKSTIDALLAAYDDLKEIITAADNGQDYTAEELQTGFTAIHKVRAELLRVGVVPPGEIA